LSCHVTSTQKNAALKTAADHPGKACPVATKDCASCHMPQFEVPEMHANFTDHEIRIVRKGEPFPD
jgi:hypothetical protein